MPGGIDPHTHLSMPFMGQVTCDDFYRSVCLWTGLTSLEGWRVLLKTQDFFCPALIRGWHVLRNTCHSDRKRHGSLLHHTSCGVNCMRD
jgi:hypothetical protein